MIKLLIVDDSALMRRLLAGVFREAEGFELAEARSGAEAIEQLGSFKPDVITLDVNMPDMDGLQTLDQIMLLRPCPVVMVSGLTTRGAEVTLEALELGAVDFVTKPAGAVSLKMELFAPVLVETVRAAASARVRPTHRLAERIRLRAGSRSRRRSPPPAASATAETPPRKAGSQTGVVVIGASTGGPPALDAVLSGLPEDFAWPILVAQHMPAAFTGSLAERLDRLCRIRVVEAATPMRIEPGTAYIARGDADMILSRRPDGLTILPVPRSDVYLWHPSVDRLVRSAMEAAPPEQLAGVLLTGMGNDGARAMTELKAAGGWTLAESEQTAVVWGMPGELARAGGATEVADLGEIGRRLNAFVVGR